MCVASKEYVSGVLLLLSVLTFGWRGRGREKGTKDTRGAERVSEVVIKCVQDI